MRSISDSEYRDWAGPTASDLEAPPSLSATMRQALPRYPAATAEPGHAWGVRAGTRSALLARGLIEAVLMRTKYTNQPIYRYRRTSEGDRIVAAS